MRFRWKSGFVFFFLVLALALQPAPAEAKKKTHHPHKVVKRKARPAVASSASYADIVIDAESGEILHQTDADKLRHPASLTKMMTLYLTFQAIEAGRVGLNQYLPVSSNAAEQPPSKLGLRPGQRIRLEDAVLGLVTESANDAAVVLGEWMGGSEENFAAMMTRQARALGMSRTHFSNPSGLPNDEQVTTARDMAVLGDALITHFPQYYPYFSRDGFVYGGVHHRNHNRLMGRYDGMDGIKTGYIRASGFNLVASAKRGSTRLVGVVFGGHSTLERDNRMAKLLDQAFVLSAREKAAPPRTAGSAEGAQGDGEDDNNGVSGYVGLPAKGSNGFSGTPPAAARVSAPSPATGATNWGVQIGAFSSVGVAQQALSDLVSMSPQMLGMATPQVQPVSTGGATVYRARLVSLDQRAAESICSWYIKQGQSCQTIAP